LLTDWITVVDHQVLQLCAPLSLQHRDRITVEWQTSRQQLLFMLSVKFSYTQSLPFVLCAICITDQQRGRVKIRQALQQFAEGAGTSASDRPFHHRLTLKLLDPDGPLRPLVTRWLDGVDLYSDELSELLEIVIPLKFVSLVESSIERNHSIAKMFFAKAPHHSEAYYSLGLRFLELESRLDDEAAGADLLADLGELCSRVRSADSMASELGFAGHDSYTQSVQHLVDLGITVANREKFALLRPVVYRSDSLAQHKCLSEASKSLTDEYKKRVAPPRKNKPLRGGIVGVLQRYATQHLQQLVDGVCFLTCAADSQHMSFERLDARCLPQPPEPSSIVDLPSLQLDDAPLPYVVVRYEVEPSCHADFDDVVQGGICDAAGVSSVELGSHHRQQVFLKILSSHPNRTKHI
jgi:hypothetical protein